MAKASIICPCYNSAKTIEKTLRGLKDLAPEQFEVIVVDDHSSDDSISKIRALGFEPLQLQTNSGPSAARNHGIAAATGQLLIFIDSDVEISKQQLEFVAEYMAANPNVNAFVGTLSEFCPYPNFSSQYKNLYMNYVLSKAVEPIRFLYGSICGFRMKSGLNWPEAIRKGEDTYLGGQIWRNGGKISLLKDLQVIHHKEFNWISLLKNDFQIPFGFGTSYLLHLKLTEPKEIIRFSHTNSKQLGALISALLFGLLLLVNIIFAIPATLALLVILMIWFFLNADFFGQIRRRRSFGFFMQSIFFTLPDQMIMALGTACGLIFALLTNFRRT